MGFGARLRPLVALVGLSLAACSEGSSGEPRDEPVATARSEADPAPAVESERDGPAPPSVGGIVAARTDVPGVVADLVSADREQGRLSVAVRFRNVSENTRRIEISDRYGSEWRLVAGGRDWPLASEPDGDLAATAPPRRTLKPGQTALWTGSFAAPPREVTTFRLEIPGVRPFADIPIRDEE